MNSRTLFAGSLTACVLAAGCLGMAPAANAEAGGLSSRKAGKIAAGDDVPYRKRRIRNVRVHLPLGPTSIYYDYPYYYSRGYYPTHIGGYVYYPPRFYRRYHRN